MINIKGKLDCFLRLIRKAFKDIKRLIFYHQSEILSQPVTEQDEVILLANISNIIKHNKRANRIIREFSFGKNVNKTLALLKNLHTWHQRDFYICYTG